MLALSYRRYVFLVLDLPSEQAYPHGSVKTCPVFPTLEHQRKRIISWASPYPAHTKISVSIGIAMDVDDGDFGELFKKADMALYDSKKTGKSAYSLGANSL